MVKLSLQQIRRAAADGLLAEKTVIHVLEGKPVRQASLERTIAALRAVGVSESDLAAIQRATPVVAFGKPQTFAGEYVDAPKTDPSKGDSGE